MTRFSKSKIEKIDYTEIELKPAEFEETKITVSSMRLDNIVSEITRTSRKKAEEMLLRRKNICKFKTRDQTHKSH